MRELIAGLTQLPGKVLVDKNAKCYHHQQKYIQHTHKGLGSKRPVLTETTPHTEEGRDALEASQNSRKPSREKRVQDRKSPRNGKPINLRRKVQTHEKSDTNDNNRSTVFVGEIRKRFGWGEMLMLPV